VSRRRILHPTDFSPASRPAFRAAVDLAKTLRDELVVMHVLSSGIFPAMSGEMCVDPGIYDDFVRIARTATQRQLARLAAQAKRAGVHVASRLVEGSPRTTGLGGAPRPFGPAPCPLPTVQAR
jgi:nucleotide-binding universal stress UspA family protein